MLAEEAYTPEYDPTEVLNHPTRQACRSMRRDAIPRHRKENGSSGWRARLVAQEPLRGESSFVDTAPVPEKRWGRPAGLGWQRQAHESALAATGGTGPLLGAIFTTIGFHPHAPEGITAGRAGHALRLARPMRFPAPYQLDMRGADFLICTDQHDGPGRSEFAQPKMAPHSTAVTDCPAACPWNKSPSRRAICAYHGGLSVPLIWQGWRRWMIAAFLAAVQWVRRLSGSGAKPVHCATALRHWQLRSGRGWFPCAQGLADDPDATVLMLAQIGL